MPPAATIALRSLSYDLSIKLLANMIAAGNHMLNNTVSVSPYGGEVGLYFQTDFMATAPDVWQLFDKVEQLSPRAEDVTSVINRLKKGGSRLIFSAPYRDGPSRALYGACRKQKLPYLVVERGSLPGSIFLDETGFLCDSEMYKVENWRPIPADVAQRWFADFSSKYQASDQPLEKQRIKRYSHGNNLPDDKPIVSIILQKPGDTVVRHFVDEDKNYDAFLNFCRDIISSRSDKVQFIVKPHPLHMRMPLDDVIDGSQYHIDDLIAGSHAVLTFNSGTGVLSMIHEKPLGVFGRAYYGHDDLCLKVRSIKQFDALMEWTPCQEARSKFLYHLVNNCYSRAEFIRSPFGNQHIVAMALKKIVLNTKNRQYILEGKCSKSRLIANAVRRAIRNRFRDLFYIKRDLREIR